MQRDGLELGGEDPEVDVGQEAAEHQEAVGLLDALGHLVAAHRPLVDADEERVPLGDHALAQDGRGDRHAGLLGQREQLVLEAEAVDLDVGQDHRPSGRRSASPTPRRAPRGARRGRSAAARGASGAALTCRARTWSRGISM